MTSPSRASDGAVRKNRPSSGSVVSAGEVAEGEIITMPFGMATLVSIARVTPEQSPPMMPLTPSAVIAPPMNLPEAETSAIASSAPAAMVGVIDSSGPVKPNSTPILTSSAMAVPAISARTAAEPISFFIIFSKSRAA
jgi:hypothetical protein